MVVEEVKNYKIVILFLISVTFIMYYNCLNAPFLYDDYTLVVNNPLIRSFKNIPFLFTSRLSESWGVWVFRPFQIITYMLDFKLWGLNPLGYHITNLSIHFLNAFLLYYLIFILGESFTVAFFASVFFLIHPLNTYAVSYISGRADLLALMFILGSLIFYINYSRKRNVYSLIFSLVAFILAILSKEIGFLLLPLYWGYTFIFKEKMSKKVIGILAVISLIYIGVRFLVLPLHLMTPFSWRERFLTSPEIFLLYIALIFFPLHLRLSYAMEFLNSFLDFRFIIPVLLFLVTVRYLFYLVRMSKQYAFGLYWYLVNFLFISNIFIPLNAPLAPHWLYCGLPGFWFSFFALTYDKVKNLKATSVIYKCTVLGMGLFFICITIENNQVWSNPFQFYQREIKFTPTNYKVHFNLGILYFNQDRLEEAEQEFKDALVLNPRLSPAFFGLGLISERRGKIKEAKYYYQQALKINPDFKEARKRLSNLEK